MAWRFVLVKLDGTPLPTGSTIHKAYERKLNKPLNGLPTASVRLNLTDPLVDEIFDLDGDVMLKVYNGTTLEFIGDLTTAEEVTTANEGKPPALVCNFAGPLWRLKKRLCGKTDYAATPPNTDLIFSPMDRGAMLWSLIDTSNTEGGDTGIRQGTLTATTNTDAGPYRYKQIAEAIAEVIAIPSIPHDPGTTYIRRDTFDDVVTATALAGRTATDTVNTWTSSVAAQDFAGYSTEGAVYRETIFDADLFSGRYAELGASISGPITVETKMRISAGPTHGRMGVIARSSASHFVMAALDPWNPSVIGVWKDVAGTITTINASDSITLPDADVYRWIRLTIDASGNYAVWLWKDSDNNPTVVCSGQDNDLAAAGVLATGKVGIYDANDNGSGAYQRFFTEFRAFVPTTSLTPAPSDFELDPVEPVTDAGGLKIAEFNVSPFLGTTTTTIFELGGGGRSMKSYRRILDRDGMVNRAYVLDPQFPESTDNKVAENTTSIAARKWYEEVIPSDVQTGSLRQALATQHANIRGVPRWQITFEPTSLGPVYGTDYVVGDIVTGRATVNGTVRFNAQFRIFGVEVTIDDEGTETVMPTLVPEV